MSDIINENSIKDNQEFENVTEEVKLPKLKYNVVNGIGKAIDPRVRYELLDDNKRYFYNETKKGIEREKRLLQIHLAISNAEKQKQASQSKDNEVAETTEEVKRKQQKKGQRKYSLAPMPVRKGLLEMHKMPRAISQAARLNQSRKSQIPSYVRQ